MSAHTPEEFSSVAAETLFNNAIAFSHAVMVDGPTDQTTKTKLQNNIRAMATRGRLDAIAARDAAEV